MAISSLFPIAGGLLGVGSALFQTGTQLQALKLQSVILDEDIRVGKAVTDFQLRQLDRVHRFQVGAIRAEAAARGVRADSGSALEVALEQARINASQRLGLMIDLATSNFEIEAQKASVSQSKRNVLIGAPLRVLSSGLQGATAGIQIGQQFS